MEQVCVVRWWQVMCQRGLGVMWSGGAVMQGPAEAWEPWAESLMLYQSQGCVYEQGAVFEAMMRRRAGAAEGCAANIQGGGSVHKT
jgi:hypothetical protein